MERETTLSDADMDAIAKTTHLEAQTIERALALMNELGPAWHGEVVAMLRSALAAASAWHEVYLLAMVASLGAAAMAIFVVRPMRARFLANLPTA